MKKQLISINKNTYQADFSWIKKLEEILIKELKLKKEISVALVSGKQIQQMNKVYRHKDKVTDVLSFNIDSEDILGEVVICLEQAKKNANQHKKSIKDELKLLTVHGILHLHGYDHEKSEKEYKRQTTAEQEILAKL